MMDKYEEFLRRKEITVPSAGIDVENITISDELFDFQRDIVLWALKKGKAAIFAGTGLGKTLMQLEWARHIGGTVLILAPLAVSKQTIFEGGKFGISVNHCQSQLRTMSAWRDSTSRNFAESYWTNPLF